MFPYSSICHFRLKPNEKKNSEADKLPKKSKSEIISVSDKNAMIMNTTNNYNDHDKVWESANSSNNLDEGGNKSFKNNSKNTYINKINSLVKDPE